MITTNSATITQPFFEGRVLRLPLLFTLLFLGLALLPRIQSNPTLMWSFLMAGLLLLLWQAVLAVTATRHDRRLSFRIALFKPHYVQLTMHLCILVYWGWYWPRVYDFALLFLAQILFAYAFDMLLCWSRRNEWYFGFGPVPIILSTNLFLWFKEDWFYLQFLMIATGFLGKEFIRWTRDGRKTHIFNPSAFSLSVFSLLLLLTGGTELTWGQEIALTLHRPDLIYLEIFVLGLIVQYLFSVTLVTLGAAAVLLALNLAYHWTTGIYWFFDSNIPIAVFLGLHLLVTDPSTSPRTDGGRVIFGALYGASVFVLYGILETLGTFTFYDKLLCVPLLNLCVPLIDRMATSRGWQKLELAHWAPAMAGPNRNRLHMTVWLVLGGGMLATGYLGGAHAGTRPDFWQQACDQGLRNGCRNLLVVHQNNCNDGSGAACNELGLIGLEGRAVPPMPHEAAKRFVRSCDAGYPPGCQNAATQFLFYDGDGHYSAAEQERVLARLVDDCDGGDAHGCYLAGAALQRPGASTESADRAIAAYTRGCELGSAKSCGAMARMYLRGEGAPMDQARAARGFEQACDGADAASCLVLAVMHRSGTGVSQEVDRAIELVARACELGHQSACEQLPSLRGANGGPAVPR